MSAIAFNRFGVHIPEQDYVRLGSLDGCVTYVTEALARSEQAS